MRCCVFPSGADAGERGRLRLLRTRSPPSSTLQLPPLFSGLPSCEPPEKNVAGGGADMDVAGERTTSRRGEGVRNPAATTRRKTPVVANYTLCVACLQGMWPARSLCIYFHVLSKLLLLQLPPLARLTNYSAVIKKRPRPKHFTPFPPALTSTFPKFLSLSLFVV